MPQYPAFIALGTLTVSTGYTFRSGAAADWFSFALSGGGDVDNDGFVDYLFGAPAGNVREGRPVPLVAAGSTYLAFGGTSERAALDGNDGTADGIIDLSLMTPSQGYTFSFGAVGDFSGQLVSIVGDVDGVAGADILIGTPGTGNGRAHLISGGSNLAILDAADGTIDGNITLGLVNGDTGYQFNGRAANDRAGVAVGSSPDINGDGIIDLVIGAFLADQTGASNGGEAALIFGGASNLDALDAADGSSDGQIGLAEIDGSNGYLLQGGIASQAAGFAVEGTADVNGDGIADLIVGAYQSAGGDLGESYILFGGTTNLDAADLDDGVADGRIDLSLIDGIRGFRFESADDGDQFGLSVSGAGDLNGDGLADLAFGDPFSDPFTPAAGSNNAGDSYVVFGGAANFAALDAADGSSDGVIDTDLLDGTTGYRISGVSSEWQGFSLDSAGDFNGDGFDDLIASSNFKNGRAGAAYVFFGAAGLAIEDAADGVVDGRISLGNFSGVGGVRLDGEDPDDQAGLAVAGIADVNNDGMADLMVGSARDRPAIANSGDGEGYLVFSRTPDAAVTRTGSGIGQTIVGSDFVDTLSGLGGDDTLIGNNGGDTLNGGTGLDIASYRSSTAGVIARFTSPGLNTGDAANDVYVDMEGLEGTRFGDTLVGNNADNTLIGGAGHDFLLGLGANDTILGGAGNDRLNGGLGIDVMTGGTGNDTYDVDDINDVVIETTAGGFGGVDLIGSTSDYVLDDMNSRFVEKLTLLGTGDLDGTGNSIANTLIGNSGINTLSGGAGNDVIDGRGGADVMIGGTGNDIFIVDNGSDQVVESGGATGGTADRINTSVDYTLAAGLEIELFVATGAANLELTGNERANMILAGTGGATLRGAAGNDRLTGGTANDVLVGGAGQDVMLGNAGDDIYQFDSISDTAVGSLRDQIYTFATGDAIDLRGIDAITGGAHDAFDFIDTAAFTAAGQLRYFTGGGTTIIQGNVGGTLAADFEIALRNGYAPLESDFL